MYVSDGTTNATVPKNMAPEEVTFEFAQRLLAERAAAGPSKKRPSRGRSRRQAVGSK
jgi:DNA topoisomerase-1